MRTPDFSAYHIATVVAGAKDPHAGDSRLFMVSKDQKRHYYEAGAGSVEDFRAFVSRTFDSIEDVDARLAEAGNWYSERQVSLD